MTKQEIIEWAQRRGWKLDRFGHLQKTFVIGENRTEIRRIKLQAMSVRIEKQIHLSESEYSSATNEWLHIGGGYYKDAHITPEDKLSFRKEE